jgi:hypothetical protein
LKIEDLELGLVPGTEVDIVKEGNKYVLVINPIGEVKKKCDAVLTRDRGIYVKYFRVWPDMKAASISRLDRIIGIFFAQYGDILSILLILSEK